MNRMILKLLTGAVLLLVAAASFAHNFAQHATQIAFVPSMFGGH